jgi:hypothetical protein
MKFGVIALVVVVAVEPSTVACENIKRLKDGSCDLRLFGAKEPGGGWILMYQGRRSVTRIKDCVGGKVTGSESRRSWMVVVLAEIRLLEARESRGGRETSKVIAQVVLVPFARTWLSWIGWGEDSITELLGLEETEEKVKEGVLQHDDEGDDCAAA